MCVQACVHLQVCLSLDCENREKVEGQEAFYEVLLIQSEAGKAAAEETHSTLRQLKLLVISYIVEK